MRYNQAARALFLATIDTNTYHSKFMSYWVLYGTMITHWTQNFFGFNNIAMVAILAGIATYAGKYEIFLYSTSYIHYCIYICTYYHRADGVAKISYGEFKRNCVFWKMFAVTQAFAIYAYNLTTKNGLNSSFDVDKLDYASLLMIVTGFSLASAAANALGWDRTYFGWELGHLPGKFITDWPYGPRGVPHPMIVGGVLGWAGLHKLEGLRLDYPYLALGHIALYLAHMAQEHLAIYANGKIQKEVKKA